MLEKKEVLIILIKKTIFSMNYIIKYFNDKFSLNCFVYKYESGKNVQRNNKLIKIQQNIAKSKIQQKKIRKGKQIQRKTDESIKNEKRQLINFKNKNKQPLSMDS